MMRIVFTVLLTFKLAVREQVRPRHIVVMLIFSDTFVQSRQEAH